MSKACNAAGGLPRATKCPRCAMVLGDYLPCATKCPRLQGVQSVNNLYLKPEIQVFITLFTAVATGMVGKVFNGSLSNALKSMIPHATCARVLETSRIRYLWCVAAGWLVCGHIS